MKKGSAWLRRNYPRIRAVPLTRNLSRRHWLKLQSTNIFIIQWNPGRRQPRFQGHFGAASFRATSMRFRHDNETPG